MGAKKAAAAKKNKKRELGKKKCGKKCKAKKAAAAKKNKRKLGKKGKKAKKSKKGRRMGQVCDAVLYVANACMASQSVPANIQDVVRTGITNNLGSYRRLSLYDQALNAGCTAAYNAAAGAAGVPTVVKDCFERDIVNACVNKIHELGGRRLGKKGKGKKGKKGKKARL